MKVGRPSKYNFEEIYSKKVLEYELGESANRDFHNIRCAFYVFKRLNDLPFDTKVLRDGNTAKIITL